MPPRYPGAVCGPSAIWADAGKAPENRTNRTDRTDALLMILLYFMIATVIDAFESLGEIGTRKLDVLLPIY
jgi:hypothetical protein